MERKRNTVYRTWLSIVICLLFLIMASCESNNPQSNSATESKELTSSYTPNPSTAKEELIEEKSDEDESEGSSTDDIKDPRDSMSEEEYLEYLSGTLPYVGMSEEYIDKTVCAKHTDTGDYWGYLGYRWIFHELNALVVKVDDGKVIEVNPINEKYFWDGDMPHLEVVNGKQVWKPIPGALHKRWEEHEARRDKTVDNFATAEDYADYYHDEFLDVLLAEEYFEDDIDDMVVLEESYLDAIDYWYKHQPWPEPEV